MLLNWSVLFVASPCKYNNFGDQNQNIINRLLFLGWILSLNLNRKICGANLHQHCQWCIEVNPLYIYIYMIGKILFCIYALSKQEKGLRLFKENFRFVCISCEGKLMPLLHVEAIHAFGMADDKFSYNQEIHALRMVVGHFDHKRPSAIQRLLKARAKFAAFLII